MAQSDAASIQQIFSCQQVAETGTQHILIVWRYGWIYWTVTFFAWWLFLGKEILMFERSFEKTRTFLFFQLWKQTKIFKLCIFPRCKIWNIISEIYFLYFSWALLTWKLKVGIINEDEFTILFIILSSLRIHFIKAWNNDGIMWFYFNWVPVYLYILL